MNTLQRSLALSALIFGLATGCSGDDDDSLPPLPAAGSAGDAGAGGAGDAGAASGGGGTAGSSGGPTGGMSAGAGAGGSDGGEGGTGGADSAGAAGTPPEAGAGGGGGAGGNGGEAGTAGEAGAAGASADALASSTVLDVNDVKGNPETYAWFDFKPNVKKLILAGAAETQHIAILWYTVEDGGVGLHYHSKTESVYVIDGTQTDAKGVYTDGTVYFNPPGSGHQITDSSGFFLLAYAAPPDFVNTDSIEPYTPIRIDTTAADLTTTYAFTEQAAGVQTYTVPLVEDGGLSSQLIETSSATPSSFFGNYLLVLKGSCDIEGVTLGEGKLVVAKALAPQPYAINASTASSCLALGVSF